MSTDPSVPLSRRLLPGGATAGAPAGATSPVTAAPASRQGDLPRRVDAR